MVIIRKLFLQRSSFTDVWQGLRWISAVDGIPAIHSRTKKNAQKNIGDDILSLLMKSQAYYILPSNKKGLHNECFPVMV